MTKRTLLAMFMALIIWAVPTTAAIAQENTRWCPLGDRWKNGLVLDAVQLNGSTASRTFTFGQEVCGNQWVASYKYLVIEADYTHVTDGNVLFTCTNGQSVEDADKTPTTCVGAGTCIALDGGVHSKAVTAATKNKYSARFGIRGYVAWSCIVSHDNTPAAGNLMTAKAYLTD